MSLKEGWMPLEYRTWENIEEYPTDPVRTGHPENILHPGLFYISRLPDNPRILTKEYSDDVRRLCELNKEEIVLAELVPEPLVSFAIDSLATTLYQLSKDLKDVTYCSVEKGGNWLMNQIKVRYPQLIHSGNSDSLRTKATEGEKLKKVSVLKSFSTDVRGKTVLFIEDLIDRNETLEFADQHALKSGASKVMTMVLFNKLDVPGKKMLPHIQMVGFGTPNKWMGGCGSDIQDDICRKYPFIVAKLTMQQLRSFQ